MDSGNPWGERSSLRSIRVAGVDYAVGDRVRLRPRGSADILDLVLENKAATIAAIEQDVEDRIYLAVTVDEDPGRDLGAQGKPAHRFFFRPEEVEVAPSGTTPALRILVAGIGNIFLGDDAFGVEVVRRLAGRRLPAGVRVVDFGIRGFDLSCALLGEDEAVILVDATPRGEPPGTLSVLELDVAGTGAPDSREPPIDPHGLDPVRALRLAATLGGRRRRVLLVGCEPLTRDAEAAMGLSEPVQAAVAEAVRLIESIVAQLRAAGET